MKKQKKIEQKFELSKQYYEYGSIQLALSQLQELLELDPNHTEATINVSFLALLLNDIDLAISSAERATKLSPNSANAFLNLANALKASGDVTGAILQFNHALTIDKNFVDAWTGLNLAYKKIGQFKNAVFCGRKCVELNPKYVNGLSNLAITLQDMGDTQEAHELLCHAIKYSPTTHYLHSNMLMNMQYLPNVSSTRNLQLAKSYPCKNTLVPIRIRATKEDKHIGFVSADFRIHPVGFFFRSVLKALANKNIRLTLFLNQSNVDEITQEIISYASKAINISCINDQDCAAIIAKENVDILVDMSGHTAGNRLPVFQMKPAPVLVSWLGYFATTGLQQMDYVFMSKHQASESTQSFFSEKLVLHDAAQFVYAPPEYTPDIVPPPCIKNGYITFGSFNNIAKLNHEVISAWAKILKQTPNSRLVLKWKSLEDESVRERVCRRFASLGVNPELLEMRGHSSHVQMLEEYQCIDIALDPFPFSGALTTCEALWMGKPVVTLYQERPVSRQSYAILKQIEKQHWCAPTILTYVKIATELAADYQSIQSFSQNSRGLIRHSDLMNNKKLADQIDRQFMIMLNKDN